ncbi:protein Gawky-like, partial [Stegodyphus dumicola]|uniref:protein Gawky-like n=1 Tax=Stegodyphus dumicola TaxID=202533 RepID=UPI0015ADDD41
MPLVKQHNTWAQAAGKGLNSVGNGPTNPSNTDMESDQDNSGGSASKVMRMEENVNESQIAAAFSEGWGQRGINQETAWDVPSSPHLSPKEGSTWTSSTSTGTEIWENNIRHHIKNSNVKAPAQIREPWGHTPSTHIGGTWGEEEDTTNLWTGVPQASGATWGSESNTSVWGTNPVEGKNWSSQNNSMTPSMNPNWGSEPPALQIGLPHLPLANENKSIEEAATDNGPPWGDPSHKSNRTFGNWSPVSSGNKKMPPSGWEETVPPPTTCQSGPNYDDGTAVWGNPVHQAKVSHWKEMPPAKQMPDCILPPGNLCQSGNPCAPHAGPGMIRLPQAGANMNQNDNSCLKNQSLNRRMSWSVVTPRTDPSGRRFWVHLDANGHPIQDKSVPGTANTPNSAFGNWGEPVNPVGNFWGAKSKSNICSWADGQVDTSSWGGPMKQGGKPLSKDLIWASKQFRILMEMNFKKDDIENALRRSNMNLEEALLELHAMSSSKDGSMLDIDGLAAMNLNQTRVPHGNVADDINFAEHSIDNTLPPGNIYGGNDFPGMSMFSTYVAQNCKNQNAVGNNIAPNVLGSAGTNNQVPNFNLNNGINNLSPAMMRKILQQTQTFNPSCLPQNTGRMAQQNFPSTAQLRHLVQQIQMAVQAGHLNPTVCTFMI